MAVSAVAVAQEPSTMTGPPSDELVTRWLESGDARLAAWGAHAVLAGGRHGLLPLVEERIGQWETQRKALPLLWDREHFYGLVTMLDTLIQMDGTLPAETLEEMDGVDAARVTLLLRLPWEDAGSIWKRLYQLDAAQEFGTTRVAEEMLAEHPPVGFAADVLGRITVSGQIVVVSPNTGMGYSGTSLIGDCGFGPPVPEDWPDVGSYALQDSAKHPGAKLLLDGPPPVYLIREVTRRYAPDVCGGFSRLTDTMRAELVGTMLRRGGGGTPLELTPKLTVEFHDREAYRKQAVAFVEAQQAGFDRVTASLEAGGLMTDEERHGAALHMRLWLTDARAPGGVDLPLIAFRPPVEWVPR